MLGERNPNTFAFGESEAACLVLLSDVAEVFSIFFAGTLLSFCLGDELFLPWISTPCRSQLVESVFAKLPRSVASEPAACLLIAIAGAELTGGNCDRITPRVLHTTAQSRIACYQRVVELRP